MSHAAALSPPEASGAAGSSTRLYLPELDGLRFVAFALVYLFHGGIPQPLLVPLVGTHVAHALRDNGWVGVQLFFILSGYLITTLLLREEATFGWIDLRAFWIRRVLRIWPLYYLIVAIGFLLIPAADGTFGSSAHRELLGRHLAPFLMFLGNWSMCLLGPVPYDALSVLWSVCVEEQFYLVVPLIVAFVGRRYRVALVSAAIGLTILARWLVARSGTNEMFIRYNTFLCFDTLLSGVLLALVVGPDPGQSRSGRWVFWLQWPLYAFTAWLFSRSQLGLVTTWRRTLDFVWIWAWGVAVVAILVHSRGWFRRSMAYSRMVWLGKISYGLYMYHEIALWLKARMYYRLAWFPNKDVLLTIATFAMTVGLAAASYYLYERRFLALKGRWTRVASRPV